MYLLSPCTESDAQSRKLFGREGVVVHSFKAVQSFFAYQLSINKLTAALKKSKQISLKGTVHLRTDLNIIRKEKAESSEINMIAKLFELVDCCSEHVERGETPTVKCLSLLFVTKVFYPLRKYFLLAVKNDYL